MSKKKLELSDKSLKIIGRKKKNIIVWIGIVGILFAFILAMYNGIDMDAAIKANALKNRQLENPDLKDINESGDTKVTWAINMENTVDGLKEFQVKTTEAMAKKTREDIIKANAELLNEIKTSNKVLQGKIREVYDENLRLKKEINLMKNATDSRISNLNKKITETKLAIEDGVMLPPPALNNQKVPSQKVPSSDMFSKINIDGHKQKQAAQTHKKQHKQSFEVLSYANELKDENATNEDKLTEEEKKAKRTFEVLTGFTDAYMLTGAYVPLFGNGGGGSAGAAGGAPKPVPVLFETSGDLLMPNHSNGSIDKCFVLGVSSGNAGARSVEIRLDKMTCVVDDGKRVLQGKISGYVVSETGTPGLPATLIYKAGDFISRMIGAGILEGLSTALTNYAASYGNSATLGGTTQVYGGAMNGASNGVNNAFSKLADFYLQLAEATMPILEVKPGRFVSMVVTGGNKFELKDVNLLNVNDTNAYIDEFIGEE